MKPLALLLACFTATVIDASDSSARLEWNWRHPVGMLFSGQVGTAHIGNDNFMFGTRGKVSSELRGALRHPTTEATIRDVAQGAGAILAVGDGGLIWRQNSNHWTEVASGTSKNLNSAVFAQSKWILVGSNIVLCSSNGSDWANVSLPPGFPQFMARKALFTRERFYLFGADNAAIEPRGLVASSTDGLVWQRAVVPEVSTLVDAVAGDSGIVAVSDDGSILSSQTGADWTVRWRAQDGSIIHFVSVAWGAGRFVALAHDGIAMTSTTGMDWTPLGDTFGPDSHPLYSFFYTYADILFADDSKEFQVFLENAPIRKSFSNVPLSGLIYHDASGPNLVRYASVRHDQHAVGYTRGDTWFVEHPTTTVFAPFSLSRLGYDIVLHTPGRFSFRSRSFVEEPGPNFTSEKILEGAAGSAIAITLTGEIYQSSTPRVVDSWSLVLQVPNTAFTAVAYGNDRFVVVGRTLSTDGSSETGVIYTSVDGRSWNRTHSSEIIVRDVAFGSGFFTVVGQRNSHGISLVSSTGTSWSPGEQIDGLPCDNIAYGRGRFLASAFNGRPELLSSLDGRQWRKEQCTMDNRINEIAFSGETFIILGPAGEILESAFTYLEARASSTLVTLTVTSTYHNLEIEASSDLKNWSSFTSDSNRFRIGSPSEVPSSVARTTKTDSITNIYRFYRARTVD